MMKPTYAAEHIDLSGMYAYRRPEGRRVLWDGGIRRELWSPSWTKIPEVGEGFKNQLPNTPLEGYFDGDHLTVTALPDLEVISNIIKPTEPTIVKALKPPTSETFCFLTEIIVARTELTPTDTYSFVNVKILPENKEEARRCFESLGEGAVARHARSYWLEGHTSSMVTLSGFTSSPGWIQEGQLFSQGVCYGSIDREIEHAQVRVIFDGFVVVGYEVVS